MRRAAIRHIVHRMFLVAAILLLLPSVARAGALSASHTQSANTAVIERTTDKGRAVTESHNFDIGSSRVTVLIGPGALQLKTADVLAWIKTCMHAVAGYYGRFPVAQVRIIVIPADGQGVLFGTANGYAGATVTIQLGRQTRTQDLYNDWMLTHELVHLAFPSVAARHNWIQEGIATYVEPLARVAAGALDEEKVWRDFVFGLPQGLPEPGDRGLDYTPTWGRTYWGGALFCLLADIEIRKRTALRFGLRDALRAINAAGGSISVTMPLAHALKIGDEAIGVPVLTELYQRMHATPVSTDLDDLWQRLGVNRKGRMITFDEQAPLAAIRRAITAQDITAPINARGAL